MAWGKATCGVRARSAWDVCRQSCSADLRGGVHEPEQRRSQMRLPRGQEHMSHRLETRRALLSTVTDDGRDQESLMTEFEEIATLHSTVLILAHNRLVIYRPVLSPRAAHVTLRTRDSRITSVTLGNQLQMPDFARPVRAQ